jgi:hypothetical protein
VMLVSTNTRMLCLPNRVIEAKHPSTEREREREQKFSFLYCYMTVDIICLILKDICSWYTTTQVGYG